MKQKEQLQEYSKKHTAPATQVVVAEFPNNPSTHYVIDYIYVGGSAAGDLQILDDTNAAIDGYYLNWAAGKFSAIHRELKGLPANRGFRYTTTGGGNYNVIIKYHLEDGGGTGTAPPPEEGGGGGGGEEEGSFQWTSFVASGDTRTVYVSDSDGNDGDDGLSEANAKKTIAAGLALIRDGFPDWLLLKCGDTFTNQNFGTIGKSGRGTSEKILISSYGTGARPYIKSGTDSAISFGNTDSNYVAVVGLRCEGDLHDGITEPYGFSILLNHNDILLEDCLFQHYSGNRVQGVGADHPTNISIRRCIIVDNWRNSASGHAQGIYCSLADTVLIEECVFDHNGWKVGGTGGEETLFNHNMYIDSDSTGVEVTGCISAQASSHGLQLRPGGICENNLFLKNSLNMFCAGEGGSPPQSRVVNNVVLDAKDIAAEPRGYGIDIFDCLDVLVQNNIVAHKPAGVGDGTAFLVQGQKDDAAGTYNMTFKDNITYKWNGTSVYFIPNFAAATIQNNKLQDPTLGTVMIEVQGTIAGSPVFSGNSYFTSRNANQWFVINSTNKSYLQWVADSGELSSTNIQPSFPDPERTIATYMTSLGGTATLAGFLTEARLQSKANWRTQYGAAAVNAYIRAGFGI